MKRVPAPKRFPVRCVSSASAATERTTSSPPGRANHAGKGVWQGITTGNSNFIGIEAENTGRADDHPWPAVQIDAYQRGVAAILRRIGRGAEFCAGHKEYAPQRKTDPNFDMNVFRAGVAAIIGGTVPTPKVIPAVEPPRPSGQPGRPTLRRGMANEFVQTMQIKLNVDPQTGLFGPKTEAAVRDLQRARDIVPDGIVDPRRGRRSTSRRRLRRMIHPQPIILEGRGIRLEPLTKAHHDALARPADGKLWELWFTSVPEPHQATPTSPTRSQGQRDGHMLPWVVRDLASGAIVGTTRYHDIVAAIDRVEIGYTWYAQSRQRTHVNTTCKLLLLDARVRHARLQGRRPAHRQLQLPLAARDRGARREEGRRASAITPRAATAPCATA